MVDDAGATVDLVLVLPALSARAEVLNLAVLDGDCQYGFHVNIVA